MILSNRELHNALDEKRLIIEPEPMPRKPEVAGEHCPYDTHSVDLRLGVEISVPVNEGISVVDLSQPGKIAAFLNKNSTNRIISEDQPYPLKKGNLSSAELWNGYHCRSPLTEILASQRVLKGRAAEPDSEYLFISLHQPFTLALKALLRLK